MNGKSFSLAQIPLFSGLPQADLEAIAATVQTRTLAPGQRLLNSGDTPSSLAILLEGRLQSHETADDGRVIGLGTIHPGEAIGWLTLIDGQPIRASINALELSHLMLIPMTFAQRLVMSSPLINERLLKLLAASIRQIANEKSMLSLPNAFHRIFVQVNQLSANTPAGQPLSQLPKQHELASIVNTSRETVSRALQLLVKSGILAKVGHQIVIKEADTLQKLAVDGPDALPDQR